MDIGDDLDNVDYVGNMDKMDNVGKSKPPPKREPKKQPKMQSGFLDKTILDKQFENV